MDHNLLSIEIELNGEQLLFDARLDTAGFIHKILINVSGIAVVYEPDEERNYRAIVAAGEADRLSAKDKEIIHAVGIHLASLQPL